jgi:hypothetical protein
MSAVRTLLAGADEVKQTLMCAIGTSRQFAATQHFGRFRSDADID